MQDLIILLSTIASGAGGVVAVIAFLRMRQMPSGSAAPTPAPGSAPQEQDSEIQHKETKKAGARTQKARRQQIEHACRDLSAPQSESSIRYSAHELELILGWSANDTDKTVTPIVCDAVLKTVHREFIRRWTDLLPSSDSTGNAGATIDDEKTLWEVVDTFDAFPELPSIHVILKNVGLRSKARRLMSIAATAIAVGIAGLIGANSDSYGFIIGLGAFIFIRLLLIVAVDNLKERLSAMISTPLWNWDEELHQTGESALTNPETFNPKTIIWHPHQPIISVTKDHLRFNSWRWEKPDYLETDDNISRRTLQLGQCVFSQGWINNVFFSKAYMLIESAHKWSGRSDYVYHYVLIDKYGRVASHLSCPDSIPPLFGIYRPFGGRRTPFRSGSHGSLLYRQRPHTLMLIAVDELPSRLSVIAESLNESLSLPPRAELDLSSLMIADGDHITDADWHPSGEYLAVEVSRRIYVIHWDSGEIVGVLGADNESGYILEEWSEDGTMLRLGAMGTQEQVAWNILEDSVRVVHKEDRWQSLLRTERRLGKLVSPTKYETYPRSYFATSSGENVSGFTDSAPCPYDSTLYATIGGDGHERDVRVWRAIK